MQTQFGASFWRRRESDEEGEIVEGGSEGGGQALDSLSAPPIPEMRLPGPETTGETAVHK